MKADFLRLNDDEKADELLEIAFLSLKNLETNSAIFLVAEQALNLAKQFLDKKFNGIKANKLSVFLNNSNEREDLGLLTYDTQTQKQAYALDIIIYTIGFIANLAHHATNTQNLMPEPVVEAKAEVVFEAFKSYEKILKE